MSPDLTHVEFANENESFANTIKSDFEDENNWVITVRFYSLLHYVEERLQSHGYNSRSHRDRKENIRNCRYIDNKVRKYYRRLEDVSRDARYECILMDDEDVEMSAETLEQCKDALGFGDEEGGSIHKYST